jgi:Family of unknown function (DUF6011)
VAALARLVGRLASGDLDGGRAFEAVGVSNPLPEPLDDVRPDYFAVPDPLDPKWPDSTRLAYWYRPKRGRQAGRIRPWPPRRNRWGVLLRSDVLAQPPGREREVYQINHWTLVRAGRRWVAEQISEDPIGCAARFAASKSICCCCGKSLTDERSKTYGIGPDCRQGIRPEVLAALIERMAVAHAAERVSWRGNSRDDSELFA